jgi:hypothetical protein
MNLVHHNSLYISIHTPDISYMSGLAAAGNCLKGLLEKKRKKKGLGY